MAVSSTDLIAALLEATRTGKLMLREPAPTLTFEEALDLQLAVLDRRVGLGERLGGWKIGSTSGSSRDRMGPSFRPFGYVLASRVYRSGDSISLDRIGACRIEPEVCLVMGSALGGPHVDRATAQAAVRAIAPAFEINEFRFAEGTALPLVVADDLAQWGIVRGPESPVRDGLERTKVRVWRDGESVAEVSPGSTMDDPFLSLSRVCEVLHRHGRRLEPGQPLITGAFSHHDVRAAGVWKAEFDGIGEVSIRFA